MRIKLISKFKPKLIFKKRIIYCEIGRNGVIPKYKKIEGDKSTPIGKWKIGFIYIRKDKLILNKFNNFIKNKIISIKEGNVWCDDPTSNFYNKFVKNINNNSVKFRFEKMFRDDDVYDIAIEICYNKSPIIRTKGSAIFIHCSFDDSRPTNGCIALDKNKIIFLINNLQKKNYIYIN